MTHRVSLLSPSPQLTDPDALAMHCGLNSSQSRNGQQAQCSKVVDQTFSSQWILLSTNCTYMPHYPPVRRGHTVRAKGPPSPLSPPHHLFFILFFVFASARPAATTRSPFAVARLSRRSVHSPPAGKAVRSSRSRS